jgi:hypothetical protein
MYDVYHNTTTADNTMRGSNGRYAATPPDVIEVQQFKPGMLKLRGSVCSFIKQLYDLMHEEQCTITALAKRTGINRTTMTWWFGGSQPYVLNLEACFNALGWDLVLINRDTGERYEDWMKRTKRHHREVTYNATRNAKRSAERNANVIPESTTGESE